MFSQQMVPRAVEFSAVNYAAKPGERVQDVKCMSECGASQYAHTKEKCYPHDAGCGSPSLIISQEEIQKQNGNCHYHHMLKSTFIATVSL